jgi:uncharacterized membrane protein
VQNLEVASTIEIDERWWWGQSQRRRVLDSACVGLVVGLVLAFLVAWPLAMLLAWDVAAGLVVARVWFRVSRLDAEQTHELATREDDSRASADLLLLASSVVSLAGVATALVRAHRSGHELEIVLTVASVLTVALSWALVHTVFTLRYAHQFYEEPVGGIDFHDDGGDPDYGDFAYLGFTIGMTFQVSDTEINAGTIRRTVLHHALLAYLFGAVILAVTVNVIASLLNA